MNQSPSPVRSAEESRPLQPKLPLRKPRSKQTRKEREEEWQVEHSPESMEAKAKYAESLKSLHDDLMKDRVKVEDLPF